MMTERDVMNKLTDMCDMFAHYMSKKEYHWAALIADGVATIGLFMEIGDKNMAYLLGDRQPDEPVEGLIKEDQRIEAMDWCIFHGMPDNYHTYQMIQKII